MNTQKQKESTTLNENSVGSLVAGGLEDFATALENDKEGVPKTFTCHKISLDLNPTEYDPELVRTTRRLLRASQAVFAQFIGVSVQAVRAWEQGRNSPADSAARLMDEIRHDPRYWRKRMTELAIEKTSRKVVSR